MKALAALLVFGLAACSNPPYPRGGVQALFPQPPRPVLQKVSFEGRTVQLATMSGSGSTPLLFIHGSPGDWQAWARYLDAPALARFNPRMAVDRPGYGGSGAGQVMTDLREQARLLAALIPEGHPAVVVGHSLGGPIVGWLLLDHPEKVCGGVMVAGSIAPELEAPRYYNRLADTTLARLIAPSELLWSNVEILALQGELQKLDREWARLRRPLVVVQGLKDELVDPATADYAERRIPADWIRIVRVPAQGHFVLWNQPQTVIDAIHGLPCASGADDVSAAPLPG
ncbi:MAG: alpha/beta hydrolase [Stagnimonas sp.]|nr:alpha/beta hydrolase [Stagnimonas sp.]